jgi:hypothetical protein
MILIKGVKIISTILFCFIMSNIMQAQTDSSFSLCGTGRKNPYYYPQLRYRGEFRELKAYFYQYFAEENFKNLSNNSGIVRIQFQVNCNGTSGNFSIKNCDFKYKVCEINESISSKLLNLTKSLNGWIPAKDEKGNYINSHKFFAFKIKDGQLIDILPK